MKIKLLTLSIVSLVLFSFMTVNKVLVKQSEISWKGFKVGSSHQGTVKLKSGHVDMVSGKITGGEFVVDMSSLSCTDLAGGWATKLNNHLKSKDFFSTATHKTSKIVFTKSKYMGANKYKIQANLTIKGITKPIAFELQRKGKAYTTTLKVNRLSYNIQYNSGSFFENLGDKLILDDFELAVQFSL